MNPYHLNDYPGELLAEYKGIMIQFLSSLIPTPLFSLLFILLSLFTKASTYHLLLLNDYEGINSGLVSLLGK
jgi:hypothetical protein